MVVWGVGGAQGGDIRTSFGKIYMYTNIHISVLYVCETVGLGSRDCRFGEWFRLQVAKEAR